MSLTSIEAPKARVSPEQLICSTWFERDRQHVRLEAPDGTLIFELWDEDVTDAIESGYLTTPRRPRPCDDDWHQHAIGYAIAQGLLDSEGVLTTSAASTH